MHTTNKLLQWICVKREPTLVSGIEGSNTITKFCFSSCEVQLLRSMKYLLLNISELRKPTKTNPTKRLVITKTRNRTLCYFPILYEIFYLGLGTPKSRMLGCKAGYSMASGQTRWSIIEPNIPFSFGFW